MKRVKCTIAYDGSNFSGFQIQPNKRTVQGELEKALAKMHQGKKVRLHASGRTDAGVHAVGQVLHFDTALTLPPHKWKRALESLLPADIQVMLTENAEEDFHARFSAIEKEYRYFVLNRPEPDIFRRQYIYHSPYKVNMEQMQQACQVFEGTHDFTTFASAKSTAKGCKVRTLSEVSCNKQGDIIEFVLRGNGFLQHMVRIIVGALLETGTGRRTPNELAEILAKQDRRYAGKTIPSEGLYLWKVSYDKQPE